MKRIRKNTRKETTKIGKKNDCRVKEMRQRKTEEDYTIDGLVSILVFEILCLVCVWLLY